MKQDRSKYIYIVILILGLCSCKPDKTYRVWVLHSYQKECSWMDDMNKGIKDAFDDEGVSVDLDISYLNSIYTEERCRDTVLAMLNRMERPDMILSVNDQATKALLTADHPYTEQTNGCMVVFCGVDYPDDLTFSGHSNFSGFTTRVNWDKTTQLASLYRLHKCIVFIKNNASYKTAIDEIQRQQKQSSTQWAWSLEIDSLSRTYHDIFYHMTVFKNQHFYVLPRWDSYLSEFIKSSSNAFLSISNEGFGEGALGGYFTPSYEQAYDGARRVGRFLSGKKLRGSTIQESEKYLMVDWNQLNRFDMSYRKLPPDTKVINMPFRLRYEKTMVVLFTISLVSVVLFIAFFIYKLRRYKRQQKKLEAQARQERDSLQVITDSISEGLILIGKDGIVHSLNAEARKLLGLSGKETEYVAKPLYELIEIVDSSTSHGLQTLLDMVLKERMTVELPSFTTIQSIISGRFFLAEGEFVPLLDNADFNGAVFSFADQTDEFTTNEFLALTSTVGQLFFWWYDFNTGELIVDPGFFELFGLPDDGKHSLPMEDFLNAMNPEDKERWTEIYARQRFDRDIKTTLETRLNFNDKKEQWWEVRLAYQTNQNIEASPSLYGLCVNIQNYKEKQTLLEEARENVHRSEQLKSAFLSNMSHEIRTPLNGIIGFAKLISSNEDFDADDHKLFVETIQTNCNLLLALINDILDLARIDSDNMTYNDTDCNLSELISQVMTTQQVIIQKPLKLIRQLPENPVVLHIDRLRITQVITNLVNNAVKFTEEGSITVGYIYDKQSVKLFVSDTGIGIAEEEQALIFERFFKKHDDIQGAGIGLSLCKNIVEHYGGYITVSSQLGKGTSFTVILPFDSVH